MIQSLTPSIHPPHGSLLITLLPFFRINHIASFSACNRHSVRLQNSHRPPSFGLQCAALRCICRFIHQCRSWRRSGSCSGPAADSCSGDSAIHEVSSRHLRRASPRRVASSCVWGCGVVPCLPLHDGTWSMEHPWGHRHFEQIVTGSGTCWVWALGKKERLAMFPALWHLLIFRCLSSQNSRSSPSNERSWIWHLQLVSSARGSAARFMKATAYMLRVANDELHQNDGVLSQALI